MCGARNELSRAGFINHGLGSINNGPCSEARRERTPVPASSDSRRHPGYDDSDVDE
jgi:hypothetical protein